MPVSSGLRGFSTTASRPAKSHTNALKDRHANVPPYPYGPAKWYKQSNTGLYGGQSIRFGNNVGEKSERRSPRSWHPNLITRNLKSTLLGSFVRVKLTTRVLRTIDKAGGIDAYLLGTKPTRLKELGMEGWRLRCRLLASSGYKALSRQEREALSQAGEAAADTIDSEGEDLELAQSEARETISVSTTLTPDQLPAATSSVTAPQQQM
ncbi:hypothetical protein ANO11243_024750 [Dothideomycetidae sp. 11243]|nr:hypothetical protein ANO11243_024750 [fungal sp. No.11243]